MDDTSPAKTLPQPGELLAGKYRVQKSLREGGMGAVLVANHEVLNQLVAVKVLLEDAANDEAVIHRFLREAQSAAKLQSEHVARVMDAGTLENGLPFMVMELLEGCDLSELLTLNGPLPVEEAVDCVIQALEGIAQTHAAGIIHRDLKPSNIFLALRPDGTNVIKILDFGISKSTGEGAAKFKTLTGKAVLGSPAYMSPEQIRNPRTVDARSDIWSIGVALYEILTGAIPFDGDGVGEILAAVLERDAPSACLKRTDVPPELDRVIGRCLKRERENRYNSAAELARALAPFGSGRYASLAERMERPSTGHSLRIPTPLSVRVPSSPAHVSPDAATIAGPDESHSPGSAKVAFARTDGSRRRSHSSAPPRSRSNPVPPRRNFLRGAVLAAGAGALLGAAILAVVTLTSGARPAEVGPLSIATAPSIAPAATPSVSAASIDPIATAVESNAISSVVTEDSGAPTAQAEDVAEAGSAKRGPRQPPASYGVGVRSQKPNTGRPAILKSRD